MSTYHFAVVLEEPAELTEELAERLFAAGCDDATPGQFNVECLIDFSREADDLESAIQSAISNVRASNCRVRCVRLEGEAIGEVA